MRYVNVNPIGMSKNPPNKKNNEEKRYQIIKLRIKNGIITNLKTNIVLLYQLRVRNLLLRFTPVIIALIILVKAKTMVIKKSIILIPGFEFLKMTPFKIKKICISNN